MASCQEFLESLECQQVYQRPKNPLFTRTTVVPPIESQRIQNTAMSIYQACIFQHCLHLQQ